MASLANSPATTVFFEAPHRIERSVAEIAVVLGERPICVCRELTKLHEELTRGSAGEVLASLGEPRGEYTVVVGPATRSAQPAVCVPTDAALADESRRMARELPGGKRVVVRELARRHGMRAKDVYQALERAKASGK
jgi:16S rRNA (cytidine1402-2'-O)-methyltransferase